MSMMKFKYTDHDCAYEPMSNLSLANIQFSGNLACLNFEEA